MGSPVRKITEDSLGMMHAVLLIDINSQEIIVWLDEVLYMTYISCIQ